MHVDGVTWLAYRVRQPITEGRGVAVVVARGSKHWWIEAVDAPDLTLLDSGRRTVCPPGGDLLAVKDPVVERPSAASGGEPWRMWVCCHPLQPAGHEDRMHTRLATSPDGLRWDLGPTVLAPRAGEWDAAVRGWPRSSATTR